MAIFNPDVNVDRSREYLGLSQPIETHRNISPEGRAANTINPTGIKHTDVSGQLAYEGTAGLISSGAKLGSLLATEADTIIKDHLQNEVTTQLVDTRDKFIAGLMGQKGKLTQAGVPASEASYNEEGDLVGGEGNDTLGSEPSIPSDVQQVPVVLGKIANAKATRQDRFELDMKAYNYLKDMRSRWGGAGGYGGYIDNVAESLGFGNSANRVISGALARINAAGASTDREQKLKEARSFAAMSNGIITDQQYAAVTRQEPGAYEKVVPLIAKWGAMEAKSKELEFRVKNEQQGDFLADRSASAEADKLMWKSYRTLNPGGTEKSAQAVAEMAIKAQEGTIAIDPKQMVALGETLTASKARFRADMIKWGTETTDARGQPIYMSSGSFDKFVEKHIKPREELFDVGIKALGAKDYSLAARTSNHVDAMTDDQTNKLIPTSTGEFLLRVGGLYKITGEGGKSLGPIVMKEAVLNGTIDATGQYLATGHEQTILNNMQSNPNVINTPKGSITDAQGKRSDIPDLSKVVDGFLKNYERVTDPKYADFPQVQAALIRGVYSTGNVGLLDKFAGKDKYDVYSRFTTPDFVAATIKVDKQFPQLRLVDHMKNWTGSEFFHLFKQDLKSMDDLPSMANTKAVFDLETNQFHLAHLPGKGYDPGSTMQSRGQAQYRLDNLNRAIKSFSNVYTALGEDPGPILVSAFRKAGYTGESKPEVDTLGPRFQGNWGSILWRGLIDGLNLGLKPQARP